GILRLVARRARREDLEALEQLVAAPLPPGRAGLREGLSRDVAFHEGLWRLAGNRFVWSLRGLLVRYFADLERRRERRLSAAALRRAHAQHAAILRALLGGDVDRAVRLLERNLATFPPPGDSP
ncbi:MAG: FCD domain-containing protein, partial [Planctomycetota bacterium]